MQLFATFSQWLSFCLGLGNEIHVDQNRKLKQLK